MVFISWHMRLYTLRVVRLGPAEPGRRGRRNGDGRTGLKGGEWRRKGKGLLTLVEMCIRLPTNTINPVGDMKVHNRVLWPVNEFTGSGRSCKGAGGSRGGETGFCENL